jgi:hypothetical protein
MEAARLGLHDFQLGGLRAAGLEPWLAASPLSTLSHALPGFLAHPHAAYASYLTAPTTVPLGLAPHTFSTTIVSASSSTAPPPPPPLSPAASSDGGSRLSPGMESAAAAAAVNPNASSLSFPSLGEAHHHHHHHRLSSINALRLRAKEQMELFKENGFVPR